MNKTYLSKPCCVLGSRIVPSAELATDEWPTEEIIKRTGIQSRRWVTDDEDVVSLAIRATENLLAHLDAIVPAIKAVICSTTTPREPSPSIACQVATHFRGHERFAGNYAAFDLNAACSGFLYGLRLAHDFLQSEAEGSILLLTSEVISRLLNIHDLATASLFADAASASLVTSNRVQIQCLRVACPLLLASPDPGKAIQAVPQAVPSDTSHYLQMDGIAVARTAYKAMGNAIHAALKQQQLSVNDISVLVPHPGSGRILQNVAEYLKISPSRVCSTLEDTGNTSSTSIPLALERYWDELPSKGYIAMTAFGAGFTTAAAMAQLQSGDNHE